ncbi:MAG: fibronectin type III domain-containing protein [candidate division Zixibacteria bacterium]|nr:fibronectin type III domain-containing protein [candidate division Zixibacteria bacterium]
MSKRLLVATGMLALALFGCSRHIETRNPVNPLPDAPPAPSQIQALLNNQSVTLTWSVANPAGIVSFKVYTYDSTGTTLLQSQTTTAYTFTVTGLLLNQRYQFSVASVNADGIEGERSSPVVATLSVLTITVNNNNKYVNSRSVQIQINATSNTTHITLSEDSTFADAVRTPFTSQKSFTLSSGEGEKTVYARLTFVNGSETGQALRDKIILDTRASIDSVFFIPQNKTFSAADTIYFGLNSRESGGDATVSLPGLSQIELFDDGSVAGDIASDGLYMARYIVQTDLVIANAVVTGKFTDEAGNAATASTAKSLLSIQSAPQAVQLVSATALSTFKINLSWTVNASSAFSWYRIYRHSTNLVSNLSLLVQTITDKNTVNIVDTTAEPLSKYYYRVYVCNSIGLSVGSNVDSATTPANTAPAGVTIAGVYTDPNNIKLAWTRNEDADFASYRIYRAPSGTVDTLDQLVSIINNKSTDTYTDYVTATTMRYRIYVYDRHGLATGSNEIIVFIL